MLYTKIKYAKQIRQLYKIRHLLEYDRHPDLSPRLGYAKYSRQYYVLKKKLKTEKILDKNGRFIETITNKWLAELPMMSTSDELHTLGFESAFNLYLALVFTKRLVINQIIRELKMNARTVYNNVKKLEKLSLVILQDSSIEINEKKEIYSWLMKYLDLALSQADADKDTSLLFTCVPGYIDGPQAYYITNYEPGRTIGSSDMEIKTNYHYLKFWEYAINRVEYFKKYPKRIMVLASDNDVEIIWLNGLPYNKKAGDKF
jgi:hypothetical protein